MLDGALLTLVFTFVLLIDQIPRLLAVLVSRSADFSTIVRVFVNLLPSILAVTIPMAFLLGVLLTAVFSYLALYLAQVTNYPFPLTWSEGNRLYDYSLVFGQSRFRITRLTGPPSVSPCRTPPRISTASFSIFMRPPRP